MHCYKLLLHEDELVSLPESVSSRPAETMKYLSVFALVVFATVISEGTAGTNTHYYVILLWCLPIQ